MAIIPLKQTVTVRNMVEEHNDGWSIELAANEFTLKCRASESLKRISAKSTAGGLAKITDEYVDSTLLLLFDKLPDINYDSEITYMTELGVTITRKPILIQPIRMINGKPTLTEVHL